MEARQELDHCVLGVAGVLVLVDEDLEIALLVAAEDIGALGE
jgi:hypothetical protein